MKSFQFRFLNRNIYVALCLTILIIGVGFALMLASGQQIEVKKSITTQTPHTQTPVVKAASETAIAQPESTTTPPTTSSSGSVQPSKKSPAPKIETPSTQPSPPIAFAITSIDLVGHPQVCAYGQAYIPFTWTYHLNGGGGSASASLDYEIVEQASPGEYFNPLIPVFSNLYSFTVVPGTVQYGDTESVGLNAFPFESYQVRVHTYSPNVAYSNWLVIPRGTRCS